MIGLRMPVETQNAYHDADRADANIMRAAQLCPLIERVTTGNNPHPIELRGL